MVQLMETQDPGGWSQILFGLARQLGFDQVLYGMVGSRHAQFERAFLRSNYSSAWRERYDAARLAYVDPTVGHCLSSTLPIVWEPAIFDGAEGSALYEEACAYGIRTGVTLPVHGPNGEFGVLSFASDAPPGRDFSRTIAHVMPSLSLVRDYAFASAIRFLGGGSDTGGGDTAPRLTRRELEVLNWVMAGKSSWEISRITNCSEATVNFHLANVRQKFNVNTRQQAVVKAIALGLISPEDRHR
ncbi:LuxR family transcriptional regulator [Massilia sp.]|uniref:helix-turn-helix transcriptional regulator n=1 Tax=Massilia sp. TaxID=1882437 RepID=UPI0028B099F9|nr:LuxR family transcriptional regulator [Massilia sp.]